MTSDNRNIILAVVLTLVILIGFQVLFPTEQAPPPATSTQTSEGQPAATGSGAVPGAQSASAVRPRGEVIAASARLPIKSPVIDGSINLKGARIDAISLPGYRQTTASDSPQIELFSPTGAAQAYFADFGWFASSGQSETALPGADTVWTADRVALVPGAPVRLTWDNGQGLVFERTITLDDNTMFTIADRVRNTGAAPVSLTHYSRMRRTDPLHKDFFVRHEGPIGVFGNRLKEVNYDTVLESGEVVGDGEIGWIGFTDTYWLGALIPTEKNATQARFTHEAADGGHYYQVEFRDASLAVAPGSQATVTTRLFAGAKQVKLLDRYAQELNIPRFDRAVDFGWFHFLTKPMFLAMLWLNDYIGNLGLAIMALTVVIKIVFFPLANKSYRSMAKMRMLQPEVMALRELHAGDKMKLNQEMMALYKRHGANPLSGCLPIVIQIPVFFALYKVLFVAIEMRHAPFYGWIKDLSARDPTDVFTLFGLLPDWAPFDFLHLGILPLAMGVSMFFQMRMNPAPPDPVQARVMMLMPIVLTFVFAPFAAGLVIYWTWNNLLSIAQQWLIMRRYPIPVAAGAGGPAAIPVIGREKN